MQQNYTESYADLWSQMSHRFPDFLKYYSVSDKQEKERVLDQYIQMLKSFRKSRVNRQSLSDAEQETFINQTRNFLCRGLDFEDAQLHLMFSDEMMAVTKIFVRQAKAFDSTLSFTDIFQACRNVWIMNGLQLILGIPMQLTPSIFAYSMLYPYTDNLLDDPKVTDLEKMIFSNRFRDRLSGEQLVPINSTERSIFRLVEMIEEQYSRNDSPKVFQSLLDIHDAQTASLRLIHQKNTISEQEIVKICFDKGGTSVLADGYLVAGELSVEQEFFLYGYGAYLQLLDDIQDVNEDLEAGLMTVFSRSVFQSPLDPKLNQTYWFGEAVMKSLEHFEGQHLELFKSLIRKSMDLFIIEAIAQTPDAYSPTYVSEFENYSPFDFSYIRKRKEQFTPYNGFLLTAIEEIAFAETMNEYA